ncbi:DUF5691 domain-containing protein [Streptomyces sp. CA-294286]|uniref:DUF5691 domain-containing protein n=1 Tax=Streptomyces sp. CA-294286 TaxID=3240070 RepID=UPI003D8EE328
MTGPGPQPAPAASATPTWEDLVTSASATPTWEDLVTSALLGTDRRPPAPRPGAGTDTATGVGTASGPVTGTGPGTQAGTGPVIGTGPGTGTGPAPDAGRRSRSGPRKDPPLVLLDAAALHTVRRRAALLPATAGPPVPVAPPDPRPALPPAARRRLAQLLADRAAPAQAAGRRGSAPDLTELLPQWLAAANLRRFQAPPALLPALLDAARARTDLRPQALEFAGTRGLWLARLNPEWKFALRGTAGGATLPDVRDAEAVRNLWEEGLFAERVGLLGAVRAADPSAARTLLASTWPNERAEDRLMFLDSFRAGLSAADEEFLERALSDRSRNVRSVAAELLSALPASAFAGRMAARATSCVGLDRTGDSGGIVVEAPHECDAAMQRDGIVAKPPAGRGERSWWLGQLVESAPLRAWTARLGGRTAQDVVALPVSDGWQEELHAAWCRAAIRQGDAQWARALLGPPALPPDSGPGTASLAERAKLLAALPDEERADWVAAFVSAHGLSEAFQLLGVCVVPWSPTLGRAVVDALDIARDAGSYPWSFSGVMGLAERCLDPDEADRLAVLTTTPDEAEGAAPGAGGYWSEAFQRLVGTLRLRAAMRAELDGTAPDGTAP